MDLWIYGFMDLWIYGFMDLSELNLSVLSSYFNLEGSFLKMHATINIE